MEISYAPSSTTLNLITLSSTSTAGTVTTGTVAFAATTNSLDAQVYTVTVSAKFNGATSWLTTSTATVAYVDAMCASASITANSHLFINTSQKVAATGTVGIWYDSVSGAADS